MNLQFLKDIRSHVDNWETSAADEIHRFIEFLEGKYAPPGPAVPANPDAVVVPPPAPVTFIPAIPASEQPSADVTSAPIVEGEHDDQKLDS